MTEGSRGKPIQCWLEITEVAEVSGRRVAVCICSNHIYGCRWEGDVNDYLLDHRLRCNFHVIGCCFCQKELLKGNFRNHLISKCKHRFVDYSITDENDDLYGCQECPNAHLGCKWEGTCDRFERVHRFQCRYQDIVCCCGNTVKKWFLAEHLLSKLLEVAEVSGRTRVAVCVCPNHIYGCRWEGDVNSYILNHRLRCNFQVIGCCFCQKELLKGNFRNHLISKCKHRFVDYSITDENDDLYGCQECPNAHLGCKWEGTCARYEKVHCLQCRYQDVVCFCGNIVKKRVLEEHLLSECVLQLNLQPGTDFSDCNKPSEFNTKPIKIIPPETPQSQ